MIGLSLARWTSLLALLATCVAWADAQAQDKAVAVRPVWTDENFDQWVFQQDQNATGVRRRLNSLLELRIEEIDQGCRLTDTQRKKLQLAGRGDIKRFFDRYEKIKLKFQSLKNDEQKIQEIWQDISPLQMTLQAGLFSEDSLVYKSLRNTLDSSQFTRYDAIAGERRAFRHRANIELGVTVLEQAMPLRDAQRRELITLLEKQTKPLRKATEFDYYVIMFQLGRVPEEKLKPLFDPTQWKVVNRQLDQFKQMEPFLKQSGQLPDSDDQAERSDATPVAAPKQEP